ncbi:tyrosine-protein kinase hopscotch [Anabrus simplex]|uniref:tyrosine-protein kinase hopscotch n=1 Tax=Anabrus simplex TaxID=316456 RepID=UPI0034DD20DF
MESVVRIISVHVYVDNDVRRLSIQSSTSAEDVCIELSKQLGIGPVARHLFALRLHGSKIYLSPNCPLVAGSVNAEYDFRLRFKVPNSDKLEKVDIKAYDYYFHQVRTDVMNSQIPDISSDKQKSELVGLGVADMYRVMLETRVERDIVENDYKKYIPKEVVKHHLFFIKKIVHDTLGKIKKGCNHNSMYVKGEYMRQFEDMAPNYLREEFKVLTDEGGSVRALLLRVNPFHRDEPGIRMCIDGKKQWQQLCTIEDLCYISVRNDGTVEISRKNGIPMYLKFQSIPLMFSFVSLLDGYYRLMVKWTFNLCKDVRTPSVQKLYALKCHGPVGGEFSYAKLEEKRNNKCGCFILRESETKYDVYYLDVCTKESSKPKTYKIEKLNEEGYVFSADGKTYESIPKLIAAYRSDDKSVCLLECLPPSEYDKSSLLLCQPDSSALDDSAIPGSTLGSPGGVPQCIDVKNLQVYKSQKKESRNGISMVYRSVLKLSRSKRMEVAMKILKPEHREKHLKDYMELCGRWAFLQSSAIVKLYGVTLSSPFAMVMEYLNLGPLDVYLQQHRADIKPVDLVEAGTYLATALWHLEEMGIVHGKIRCHKLLVAAHNENSFLVRLGDPGLHKYSTYDIHWIPVECHFNFDTARSSVAADVWAFGTTLWEIFARGEPLPDRITNLEALRKFYQSGRRLPRPRGCTTDIYKLMEECWDRDLHQRKKPQAIMRDINQILYQVFNSRRAHSYATAFPRGLKSLCLKDTSLSDSNSSIFTQNTEDTYLDYSKSELLSLSMDEDHGSPLSAGTSMTSSLEGAWLLDENNCKDDDGTTPDISEISDFLSMFHFPADGSAMDSVTSMQGIFELDGDCNVVLQGRIGQGFYGEVFRGTLEKGNDTEPKLVAVKKLKTNSIGTSLQDFEREISIMTKLKHPNIVEIKGVIQEPETSLVMEFVQHGSLQSYLKIHRETLEQQHLLKFALDVARGMEYLGQQNIVHRDLAARNILVANEHHVKISDFGLAQFMGNNGYYILKTSRELPIKWYAPESLRDGKFSPCSDVWSYGVTLYEMFSFGEDPCLPAYNNDEHDQSKLLEAIERGARLPCPATCPQMIYVRLMCPCWQAKTHERPSFTELCREIEELR